MWQEIFKNKAGKMRGIVRESRQPFHYIVLFLFIKMVAISSSSVDPSIRIAAYHPKPVPTPTRMIARRMGIEPGIIQDPPRPPRHAQEPRNRRPLDIRGRRRPQLPRLRSSNKKDKKRETDPDDELPFIVLSPDELRNPMRLEKNESSPSAPVGPPVVVSNVRSPLGAVIRPPGIRPPAPPVRTPAPPPKEFGPPTPPPSAMTPSPPPGARELRVTDIKCLEIGDQQTFDAILTLPDGYEAIPVFEDRPTIDPTTNPACRMIPTQLVGMFQLIVSNFQTCGVRKCRQSNGETWHCLVLRLPRIGGLKLPEDEMIEIRCRPHEKLADDIHVLRVATAKYADKSGIMTDKPPTVFEGLQEFECEIGLFRQLAGTQQFNTRVKDDAPLELGEKVQLWSIIKDGDGWEYSRLSEVVIQKEDGNKKRSTQNTIVLVFSDGCRNPNYKIIAENHPFKDPSNKLVNKFTFRAFMFQDMEPGDSLLISAKVIGCVLKRDCQPSTCPDDGKLGYGRRRKRRETGTVKEFQFTTKMSAPVLDYFSTTEKVLDSYVNSHVRRKERNITDWSRNLAIKIKMPDEDVQQTSIQFKDCKLYLFVSLGMSLFFCVLAISFVSFSLLRGRKKNLEPFAAPPSTESKRAKKNPLQINTSSSGSETFYSPSDTSSSSSDLRKLPVPSTVKQRKRQVNAELMGLFRSENMMYSGTYPPMLNYYGYMVVPRPQTSHQKKSVRAIKRNARARSLSKFFDAEIQKGQSSKDESPNHCSCKKKHNEGDLPSEAESEGHKSNHTSVIRITSSGSETISRGSPIKKPKPKPRVTRTDHIYSEIQEDTLPTLV